MLESANDHAMSILGDFDSASLYLGRCQVDTPQPLVQHVWDIVGRKRERIGKVVDFGAGDGRFARYGVFDAYVGYEIDPGRYISKDLPPNTRILNACAFSDDVHDADLCIGNPPYVRNQDLPAGWRQTAAATIERRTGVRLSGLANAWQYFFFLALDSTHGNGLVALVIPFEWVSRPSSKPLRDYIKKMGWGVEVYRLPDSTFDRVLTTAAIAIVDKSGDGRWRYYRQDADGRSTLMKFPTGGRSKPLPYEKPVEGAVSAKRGLSPGTQEYLTLTEGERARCGLHRGRDVIRCITSLKGLPDHIQKLDEPEFRKYYIDAGRKCWLIRTDKEPSERLRLYLDGVPKAGWQTSTCINRATWWRFTMPEAPSLLMATGFRGKPKVVVNRIGAIAVGSVCGIYGASDRRAGQVAAALRAANYDGRVVAHSHGLHKLEINQINGLLATLI